jgi:hypothetical protein
VSSDEERVYGIHVPFMLSTACVSAQSEPCARRAYGVDMGFSGNRATNAQPPVAFGCSVKVP